MTTFRKTALVGVQMAVDRINKSGDDAAGLAVGYFKGLSDLRTNWTADRTWTPNLKNGKRDEMYSLWKRAVTRSFDWVS